MANRNRSQKRITPVKGHDERPEYVPSPEEYAEIMAEYKELATAVNGVCPFTNEECIDEDGYCQDGDCLKVK